MDEALIPARRPVEYESINEIEYDDKSLSTWEMMKLTVCLTGLQFTWTVELSYGTPYLRSLGMNQELIALVWLAGPLSGLIIQPLVGAISDKCTHRLGRRRPFIIVGGLLVCLSMAGIAYSKEWANVLFGVTNGDDSETNRFAVYVAVAAFYFLDFSLNAVQASIRALILDIPPLYQQETGNAWAGRMMHVGNVIGYFTGFLDLTALFPMFGNTQMKILCIIACIVFVLSLLITCLSTKETVYEPTDKDAKPWWHTLLYIYKAFRYLPVPIQRICNVQFFAWMGWFPVLFYSTTWVAEMYARTHPTEDPNDVDFIYKATRAGSFGLLIFSFVSVAAGVIIPQLTPSTYNSRNPFTIYNIYTASHIIFFIITMTTFFVRTEYHAIAVIASIGIPWAVAMWVPYALVGEFVQKESVEAIVENTHVRPIEHHDIEHVSSLEPTSSSPLMTSDEQNEEEEEEEEFDAGMILGVHNMYIVFPQFAVSIISAGIFKLVDSISTNDDDVVLGKSDAVGWVLRFGGVMSLVAAVLSCYLIDLHIYRQA